jgi:hypothetical protein
MSMMGE